MLLGVIEQMKDSDPRFETVDFRDTVFFSILLKSIRETANGKVQLRKPKLIMVSRGNNRSRQGLLKGTHHDCKRLGLGHRVAHRCQV